MHWVPQNSLNTAAFLVPFHNPGLIGTMPPIQLGHAPRAPLRRRRFLSLAIAASAAAVATPNAVVASLGSVRSLNLYDPQRLTGLRVDYFVDGWYNPDALAQIDWFMRDRRTDETINIDPGLIDVLSAIQERSGASEPINVISGYRSPSTNAYLAARSRGVANNSYHMYGQAADIRIPDFSIRGLRDIALSLEAGGVGYYPRSDFIHVDTGPVRDW